MFSPVVEDPASGVDAKRLLGTRERLLDLVALTKPRITAVVLVTAAGGVWLAPGHISRLAFAMTMLGTSLIVGGANALNMYIERESDAKMDRTKNRPLPAGRMAPKTALVFGVVLSALAVPVLALGVNALTALLAVLANVIYVLAYTPMKQRSDTALLVGAIPGAIPPLLGWTASTARIDVGGGLLFATLFLWQIPHFHAIALWRREDYARAGLVVTPNVVGERATKHRIINWLFALVLSSLLLVPAGVAHRGYLAIAGLLGAGFLALGVAGLARKSDRSERKWARSLFAYSLLYLVCLFAALMVDPLP